MMPSISNFAIILNIYHYYNYHKLIRICFIKISLITFITLFNYYKSYLMQDQLIQKSIPPTQKISSHQFKGLFRKNITLQWRQPCTNICQILTPIICIIFTSLLKNAISGLISDAGQSFIQKYPFAPFYFNNFTLQALFPDFIDRESLQWYVYNVERQQDKAYVGGFSRGQCSGLLCLTKSVVSHEYAVYNISMEDHSPWQYSLCPFFKKSNYSTVNGELFKRISYIAGQSMEYIHNSETGQLDKLPDGGVTFKQVSNSKLIADLKINDMRELQIHRVDGITQIGLRTNQTDPFLYYFTIPQGMLSLAHLIDSLYIFNMTKHVIKSGYIYMPIKIQFGTFINLLMNTVCSILFPFSLSLLFPVFLYLVVLEKQEKLIQMMRMNGLSIKWYWFVHFLFNLVIGIFTNIIFCLAGFIFIDQGLFHGTSWLVVIVIMLGWILSQIGMSVFFQAFLSSSRSALIIGYLLSIWLSLIASTFSVALFQYPSSMPVGLTMVPTFAFNRLLYLLFSQCSADHCISSFSSLSPQMINCIITLYVSFFLFYLVGMYLFEVIPQQFGVRKSIFFPFQFLCERKNRTKDKQQYLENENINIKKSQIDQLSKQEKEKVRSLENVNQHALICSNLTKVYPNGKLAVNRLNLSINDKQIFGLLGPNGAGKTTLISLIAGIYQPTYGQAFVSGYSILNQIDQVHMNMGICPQFDILWPQLTVQQHLLFYARLKGVSSTDEKQSVQQALNQVNLEQFRKFYSKQLSGGMKRRLSVGIGLVGNPRIVFLDEPTTGLDPDNRRQLWEVLSKLKQKRSLFLTTHLMQQADTLCNKIGIITDGSLRTIGTQMLLKRTYGKGYILTVNLDNSMKDSQILQQKQRQDKSLYDESAQSMLQNWQRRQSVLSQNDYKINPTIALSLKNESIRKLNIKKTNNLAKSTRVKALISEIFPQSIIQRQINGSIKFRLGDITISEALKKLNDCNNEQIKNGWAISNSNLEDVFINVVKKFDQNSEQSISQQSEQYEDIRNNVRMIKQKGNQTDI